MKRPKPWGIYLFLLALAFFLQGCGSGDTKPVIPKMLWQKCVPDETVQCDVWVMNPDGTEATNLTPGTDSSFDFDMQWSADHSKIIFSSNRNGNPDIFIMNLDGSSEDRYPSWSPDGTKIVFGSDRTGTSDFELYTMNADGTGIVPLTSNPGFINADPAWSSDGASIIFASTRDSNAEIYIMNADGSSETRQTNSSSFDAGPFAW